MNYRKFYDIMVSSDITGENILNKDFILKHDPLKKKIYLNNYLGNEKTVNVPEGVTDITSFAFVSYHNESNVKANDIIEEIILPDSVTNIETEAFAGCRALKKIQWPKNKYLDIGAIPFRSCTSLQKIEIPSSVKSLMLFYVPDNLKEMKIPDDIECVFPFNYESVMDTENDYGILTTLNFFEPNLTYDIIDGWLVKKKNKTALMRIINDTAEARIPDGIEKIGMFAFNEKTIGKRKINDVTKSEIIPVEKVTIPKTVKKIEKGAFWYCSNLKTVIYEGKCQELTVKKGAFNKCGSFTKNEIQCLDKKLGVKKRNTTSQLERWILIHKAIKSGLYPTTEKLRQLCTEANEYENVSTSSISRDLKDFRIRFSAPLEFDRKKHGYYYTDPDFDLDILNTERKDLPIL